MGLLGLQLLLRLLGVLGATRHFVLWKVPTPEQFGQINIDFE